MLPMLMEPGMLSGRHVVAKVDNVTCVYGFQNGQMRNDESASILIRSAKLIAAYLGTVPRCLRIHTFGHCLYISLEEAYLCSLTEDETEKCNHHRSFFSELCSIHHTKIPFFKLTNNWYDFFTFNFLSLMRFFHHHDIYIFLQI
jgi:hypothetical protein